MLKRAPPTDDRNAKKQRAYRERLKQHKIAVLVPVGETLISFLIRTGWLAERESHKRKMIADAIARMLAEAARHLL